MQLFVFFHHPLISVSAGLRSISHSVSLHHEVYFGPLRSLGFGLTIATYLPVILRCLYIRLRYHYDVGRKIPVPCITIVLGVSSNYIMPRHMLKRDAGTRMGSGLMAAGLRSKPIAAAHCQFSAHQAGAGPPRCRGSATPWLACHRFGGGGT